MEAETRRGEIGQDPDDDRHGQRRDEGRSADQGGEPVDGPLQGAGLVLVLGAEQSGGPGDVLSDERRRIAVGGCARPSVHAAGSIGAMARNASGVKVTLTERPRWTFSPSRMTGT